MDEAGNHHSQQTDTKAENQTPHVLTYKWVLNSENTWTQGGEHHTLGPGGWGAKGGRAGSGGDAIPPVTLDENMIQNYQNQNTDIFMEIP